jgi:hypothetical protein
LFRLILRIVWKFTGLKVPQLDPVSEYKFLAKNQQHSVIQPQYITQYQVWCLSRGSNFEQ